MKTAVEEDDVLVAFAEEIELLVVDVVNKDEAFDVVPPFPELLEAPELFEAPEVPVADKLEEVITTNVDPVELVDEPEPTLFATDAEATLLVVATETTLLVVVPEPLVDVDIVEAAAEELLVVTRKSDPVPGSQLADVPVVLVHCEPPVSTEP